MLKMYKDEEIGKAFDRITRANPRQLDQQVNEEILRYWDQKILISKGREKEQTIRLKCKIQSILDSST